MPHKITIATHTDGRVGALYGWDLTNVDMQGIEPNPPQIIVSDEKFKEIETCTLDRLEDILKDLIKS